MGLHPNPLWKGYEVILISNIIVFVLIQSLNKFVEFPEWITDKDPIIPLLGVIISQEFVFRGLLLGWLEHLGKQKALWLSTLIFVSIHLVFPTPRIITILSIIGGYFLGWHFLKFRNPYMLIISHLMVNLSFNYLFLQ